MMIEGRKTAAAKFGDELREWLDNLEAIADEREDVRKYKVTKAKRMVKERVRKQRERKEYERQMGCDV